MKKQDAAEVEEGVEETNLLMEVGLKRRARVRVDGAILVVRICGNSR